MITNIVFASMIKDLLSILAATVIVAIFLVLMAFILSVTVVVIKCIITALINSFKSKKNDEEADCDQEKGDTYDQA